MFNYISELKREFHHIKKAGDEDNGYEPAMVILNPAKHGKSFIIPVEAFWKYIEPADNRECWERSKMEFDEIGDGILWRKTIAQSEYDKYRVVIDMAAYEVAGLLAKATGILPSVCWNLSKCLQMFDITPNPQSAAQLLMFIQDGLDELKNMPPAPPDEIVGHAGEVTIFEGGTKIVTKGIEVTETEVLEGIE
jgi:hypothetical protein